MHDELVKKTADYVRVKLHHDPSGHDWFHVVRVWRMAKILHEKEGGDLLVIELSALLHNLKEHNFPLQYEDKATLALEAMMDILQIEGDLRDRIIETVHDSKFKGDETIAPHSIEGKILQDANWLDALGAIGVARAFASGGHVGRPIYDAAIKPRAKLTNQRYQQKRETTSINYLYEKALKTADLLNTGAAREIAQKRVEFIRTFIDQFMGEWNGKDLGVETVVDPGFMYSTM